MTETRFDLRLIDKRVFAVTFVFSLIGGVNMVSSMFLPVLLARSIGMASFRAVNLLWSGLYYTFSPVLYFIALYCARAKYRLGGSIWITVRTCINSKRNGSVAL